MPGAEHQPNANAETLASELDDDQKVLVFCEDGERSASFAAELREHGIDAAGVEGGIKAWKSDQLPTQPSQDPRHEPSGPPKLPGAGT